VHVVTLSQGKKLAIGQVVIRPWILDTGVPLHGNNFAIIKAVEKLVRNPVINANKFYIYHFHILLIEIQKYWAWADKSGK
jgi:hypothetical protein